MTREPSSTASNGREASDIASSLRDWTALGARIRRAAMVSASLHAIRSVGCRLDDGAVVETPRVASGG